MISVGRHDRRNVMKLARMRQRRVRLVLMLVLVARRRVGRVRRRRRKARRGGAVLEVCSELEGREERGTSVLVHALSARVEDTDE